MLIKLIKKYIVFILICCVVSGLSIFLYVTYEKITVLKSATIESSPTPYTGEYVGIHGEHVYHRIDCPLLKGVPRSSIEIVEDDPNTVYTMDSDGTLRGKSKGMDKQAGSIDWDKVRELNGVGIYRPCKTCHPEEGAKKESVNSNESGQREPRDTSQTNTTDAPKSTEHKGDIAKVVVAGSSYTMDGYCYKITCTLKNTDDIAHTIKLKVIYYDSEKRPISTKEEHVGTIDSGDIKSVTVDQIDNPTKIASYEFKIMRGSVLGD
ncbi:MAG TPA: hypothetical protein VF941_05050 [Clostridia bacterium]